MSHKNHDKNTNLIMKNNKKRQDPWNKTDLHQNKKKSRPTDPTRKTRVG